MSHYIKYLDWLFPPDKIRTGNLYLATSLLSSSLEVNSLTAEVECGDPSILDFERNTPLSYYANPDRPMIFRVQSITRTGPSLYKLNATSTLGLLTEGQHMGGIYTGQTAQEVIASICGTVPFILKTNLQEIKLYGWLPIASPRDNLSQVLFAIGAALKTDLDGILRIEGLWDGISSTAGSDRMYTDASVDYDGKVTQVIVTEHQYVPWTEEEQLFEGTAQQGDIITFDNPMHDLAADGFTILASGANWAKVSAGSGVLTGKNYIHNTRQITKDVFQSRDPNVKTVKDATLVSLVNSQACAQRLADYYKCRERVDAPVVYKGEIPGDLVATYHPFDKTGVAACLESADITVSGTLKAQEKLLVGYVPPQLGETEYFNEMEILTQSGNWVVPDGVTHLRYVLIGGGDGGRPGSNGDPGEAGSRGSSVNARGNGGSGGTAGAPGSGGRILQGVLDVEPGQIFSVGIGSGGLSNASGGNTTFGQMSSASGSPSPAGFTEVITGKVYAIPGPPGIDGGAGSGKTGGPTVSYEGVTYSPGVGGYGWSNEESDVLGGAGGGAAAGANGGPGGDGRIFTTQIYGGSGGKGASAVSGINATTPCSGGGGGNGGGGGGGGGPAASSGNVVVYVGTGGAGGNGGAGGSGAAGLVILYYARQKKTSAGQFVDKNGKAFLDMLRRRFII